MAAEAGPLFPDRCCSAVKAATEVAFIEWTEGERRLAGLEVTARPPGGSRARGAGDRGRAAAEDGTAFTLDELADEYASPRLVPRSRPAHDRPVARARPLGGAGRGVRPLRPRGDRLPVRSAPGTVAHARRAGSRSGRPRPGPRSRAARPSARRRPGRRGPRRPARSRSPPARCRAPPRSVSRLRRPRPPRRRRLPGRRLASAAGAAAPGATGSGAGARGLARPRAALGLGGRLLGRRVRGCDRRRDVGPRLRASSRRRIPLPERNAEMLAGVELRACAIQMSVRPCETH